MKKKLKWKCPTEQLLTLYQIEEFVKTYPNDQKLGEAVRKLIKNNTKKPI